MCRGGMALLHVLTSVGRWLIGARIAKGWSLSDRAEGLGVSMQQVSRDENNAHRGIAAELTTEWVQRILDALEVKFTASHAEMRLSEVGPPGRQRLPAMTLCRFLRKGSRHQREGTVS